MSQESVIKIWNRAADREEIEHVYGSAGVKFLYNTRGGQWLADRFLSRPWFSKIVGVYQSSSWSRRKIQKFIGQFEVPMEEYESGPFRSFNEFFIRKFKPGVRKFVEEPWRMPAFAEARYLAWQSVRENQVFPVKGRYLTPEALLKGAPDADAFKGGPLLIARLCPLDYHRFHYPDHGKTLRLIHLAGRLHSVNPVALAQVPDVFTTNERVVSILETKNFGRLAYIEVGALCVGKIVQTHSLDHSFGRGDEKGYFLFGGSTVILIGEPEKWLPDVDLLNRTAQQQETLIRLGDGIASASEQK